MDEPTTTTTACQVLGETLLDEILVRAGIQQGHATAPADEIAVSLDFVVSVDRERHCVVLRGTRLGRPALEVRLDLDPAAGD